MSGSESAAREQRLELVARCLAGLAEQSELVELQVLLERDPQMEASSGDARKLLANGGTPVDDRDLMTLLFVTERLLSAQVHRLKACYQKVTAGLEAETVE